MVLVEYSESDASGSEPEAPSKPAPAPRPAAAPKKQPFQKVVDRSNRGKIVVSLPQQALPAADEPPAKRARISSATLFSGFNSMLPPPKNTAPTARPGVALKTSAEPGFRHGADEQGTHGGGGGDGAMPGASPDRPAETLVSQEQKPAHEVKLVGKPLMFRPLSVARTAKKNKNVRPGLAKAESTTTTQASSVPTQPHLKKVSLFSLHTEEPQEPATTAPGGTYKPLFEAGIPPEPDLQHHAQHAAQAQHAAPPATTVAGADSLDSIADDLRLSAASRRELFGREGGARAAKQVINFNTDQEYQHNETIRAAGEQQIHQPVRALQGGKHSLRQLVQNVHNQREALEDSFAKGKSNRKEASSRYGW